MNLSDGIDSRAASTIVILSSVVRLNGSPVEPSIRYPAIGNRFHPSRFRFISAGAIVSSELNGVTAGIDIPSSFIVLLILFPAKEFLPTDPEIRKCNPEMQSTVCRPRSCPTRPLSMLRARRGRRQYRPERLP